jgi:hypothetical protein
VTSIPVRPSDARVAKLDALADLHFEWVEANADEAGFNPKGRRKDGGDYPLHHVDLDATQAALDDFHARASKIFPPPAVGKRPSKKQGDASPGQLELPIAASAGYDAARIAAELASAVGGFTASWQTLVKPIVAGLVADVNAALTGGGVGRLTSLAAGTGAVTALGTALGGAMRRLAARAARRAAAEVEALGVAASAGTADASALQGQADVTAHLVGQALSSSATRTALLHAGRDAKAVAAAVEQDLREIADLKSGGFILSNLESALAAAQAAGRMATFEQVEDKISLMSNESNDRSACERCSDENGKVYRTFAAAAKAYPAGKFVGCSGRDRCRGHLQPVARLR